MKHEHKEAMKRNAEWLANRPLWAVDKLVPALCKYPKRWLSYCNSNTSTPQMGFIDMPSYIRSIEIKNSQANRRK